jgi:hypothetical protein
MRRRREARRDRHGEWLGDVLGIHIVKIALIALCVNSPALKQKGIELVRCSRAGSLDRDAYFAPRAPHA